MAREPGVARDTDSSSARTPPPTMGSVVLFPTWSPRAWQRRRRSRLGLCPTAHMVTGLRPNRRHRLSKECPTADMVTTGERRGAGTWATPHRVALGLTPRRQAALLSSRRGRWVNSCLVEWSKSHERGGRSQMLCIVSFGLYPGLVPGPSAPARLNSPARSTSVYLWTTPVYPGLPRSTRSTHSRLPPVYPGLPRLSTPAEAL